MLIFSYFPLEITLSRALFSSSRSSVFVFATRAYAFTQDGIDHGLAYQAQGASFIITLDCEVAGIGIIKDIVDIWDFRSANASVTVGHSRTSTRSPNLDSRYLPYAVEVSTPAVFPSSSAAEFSSKSKSLNVRVRWTARSASITNMTAVPIVKMSMTLLFSTIRLPAPGTRGHKNSVAKYEYRSQEESRPSQCTDPQYFRILRTYGKDEAYAQGEPLYNGDIASPQHDF